MQLNEPGDPKNATPSKLTVRSSYQSQVITEVDAQGVKRIYAPETDVFIEPLSETAYEMRFYHPGDTNELFAMWRVEDPDGGTNGYNRLLMTKLTDGETNDQLSFEWVDTNELVMVSGMGLREDRVRWTMQESAAGEPERVDVVEISAPGGSVVSRAVRTYRTYLWGPELVEERRGAEGAEEVFYEAEYYHDDIETGRFGNMAWEKHRDGSWTRYDYDTEGRRLIEVTPWLDGNTNAPDGESVVMMWDYSCLDPNETPHLNDLRWRTQIRQIADNWVSTTYRAYYADGEDQVEITEDAATETAGYGDVSNRRTTRRLNGPGANDRLSFKPLSVIHPDGTEDTWEYSMGSYAVSSPDIGVFTEQENGDFMRVTETLRANLEEPYKSTRTVSILDAFGREVQTETWVCTGSNQYARMDWQTISRDEYGRELIRRYANGLSTESTWGCCGKESETQPDGQSWTFVLDTLGRTTYSIKDDGPTEAIVYDAAGNSLSRTLSGGGLSLATSNRYDLAGRLVESWDEAGLLTTIEYVGLVKTIIHPGGATEITTQLRDGKISSNTGTEVIQKYFTYGIETNGSQWAKVYTATSSSPVWDLTVRDREGRIIRTERPGFGGSVITNAYEYDDDGLLTKETSTGSPDRLYIYDERGELYRSGLDVDDDGSLTLASMDRIQERQNEYVLSGTNWLSQQTLITYPTDNSDMPLTNSVQRRMIGGSSCACEAGWSESVDAHGNVTETTQTIVPLLKRSTTTITRTGITGAETVVVSNGLLQSRTMPTSAEYVYEYDGLERRIKTIDPRTGTNSTVYLGNGRVDYTEDAAGYDTTYGYDGTTGRRISITDAMTNTVYTAYDVQGRVTNTWGATYPVAYEYDAYGRLSALKTWRDTNGAPDVTQWFYDEATGLMTNKVYADDKGPTYEYDAAGRLTRRTWARGVTNAYAYDALGQLTGIDYSDSTPDVTVTYDRLGRPLTITDVLGTRTNVYDALTLLEEQLPNGAVLQRTNDSFGRASGIALDAGYAVGYGYDANGRFASVSVSNGVQVDYAYVTNSSLLAGWSVTNGPAVAFAYEPNRDLRTNVVNTFDGSPITSFAYVNDAIGRRTIRVDEAVASPARTNFFGFNARSELTSADMPSPIPAGGTNLYAYAYDPIGNRQLASVNEVTNLYMANELNQYANINAGAVEPVYDLDGNLIQLGPWVYSWDGENRLISVSSNGVPVVQNQYDFMSRRIMKATASATNTFLYDGWNLIHEEIEAAAPSSRSYIWGLDLSGTLQGAGGVGGLLAILNPDFSLLMTASDANGNISDLVDTNGTVVAHYEYDPYGNTITQSGDYADLNPFRFSSKHFDAETGLYYFGYRFYDPQLGRWINRDPIGESGGVNLDGFVNNSPINRIDYLGYLSAITDPSLIYPPGFSGNPHMNASPCGGVAWSITWGGLPAETGYIIQHIIWQATVFDCENNVIHSEDAEYWELWSVKNGSVSPSGNDTWSPSLPGGKDTKGLFVVSGTAAFYDGGGVTPPALPPGFISGGSGLWGPLPHMGPPGPSYWPLPDSLTRGLTYSWDCCCPCRGATVWTHGDLGSNLTAVPCK